MTGFGVDWLLPPVGRRPMEGLLGKDGRVVVVVVVDVVVAMG